MLWSVYRTDFDKLKFPKDVIKGPVRYVKYLKRDLELPPNLETEKDLKIYVRKNAKEIFLTKQKSWSSENEYRVVCPDQDKLDISGAILQSILLRMISLSA